jgi:hypothetical protein
MATNTFLTSDIIAREAAMRLQNNLVLAGLVYTDASADFANRGDTVNIRKPATFTAQNFTSTTSAQNITESSVPVKLDLIADVTAEITSKQLSLNIEDFGSQVVEGAVQALAQKVDEDIAGLYIDVNGYVGAGGTTPDGLDDIAGVKEVCENNKVLQGNRSLVLNPAAESKFLQLPGIVNAEKSGSTQALRDASLGRVYGFNTFMDQNIKVHTAGAYGKLTDVKCAGTAGASTVVLTSTAGASTAKLEKGDVFTVGAYQYVVTAQTAAAIAGVVTVSVAPAVKETTTVTVVSFGCANASGLSAQNLGFHRNAFALVSRPIALPLNGLGSFINYNGLTIRTTFGYDMSTKVNTISFDILYGVKTLDTNLAVRLLG